MSPDEIALLPYRPCVGLMILNNDNHVFVGQRIDTPEPVWQMPQGGMNEGESPRDTALRELGEETGLTPREVQIVAESSLWRPYDLPHERVPEMWNGQYRGQQQKWFLLRFLSHDSVINIDTEDAEFRQWRWLEPGLLVDNAVPFKREVYASVLQEFSSLLSAR